MKLALCTGTLDHNGRQGIRQERDIEVFSYLIGRGKLSGVQLYIVPGTKEGDLAIFRDLQQRHGIEYIIHGSHVGTNTNFPDPTHRTHNMNSIREARMAHENLNARYTLFHPGGAPRLDIDGGRYRLRKTDPEVGLDTFKEMIAIMLDTFEPEEIIFENEPLMDFNREILFWEANGLIKRFPILEGTGVCYDVVHAYVSAAQLVAEELDSAWELNPEFRTAIFDSYKLEGNPGANLIGLVKDADVDKLRSIGDMAIARFMQLHEGFMDRTPEVFHVEGTNELALIDQDADIDGRIGALIRYVTMDRIGKDVFVVYEGSTLKGRETIERFH